MPPQKFFPQKRSRIFPILHIKRSRFWTFWYVKSAKFWTIFLEKVQHLAIWRFKRSKNWTFLCSKSPKFWIFFFFKRSRILLISNTHKHDLSTFKPKEMVMQWVELLHIDALSSVKKGPLGEKRSTFSQCHPYFNILATALSRM